MTVTDATARSENAKPMKDTPPPVSDRKKISTASPSAQTSRCSSLCKESGYVATAVVGEGIVQAIGKADICGFQGVDNFIERHTGFSVAGHLKKFGVMAKTATQQTANVAASAAKSTTQQTASVASTSWLPSVPTNMADVNLAWTNLSSFVTSHKEVLLLTAAFATTARVVHRATATELKNHQLARNIISISTAGAITFAATKYATNYVITSNQVADIGLRMLANWQTLAFVGLTCRTICHLRSPKEKTA